MTYLQEASQAIDKANYTADARQTVAHIGTAVEAIIAHLKQQAEPVTFVPLAAKDCGVHELVKQMQANGEKPNFCTACGANVPPIIGEGTCNKCDPLGFLQNPQLSDTQKLAALMAEVKWIRDWRPRPANEAGEDYDPIDEEFPNEALEILRAMNKIISLGDLAYSIREREGQGWEGPQVVAWGIQCAKMKKLLDASDDKSTDTE